MSERDEKGRFKPKEIKNQTVESLIEKVHSQGGSDDGFVIPTTSLLAEEYSAVEGEEVHPQTMGRFLEETDEFWSIKCGDYTGWTGLKTSPRLEVVKDD